MSPPSGARKVAGDAPCCAAAMAEARSMFEREGFGGESVRPISLILLYDSRLDDQNQR